MWVSVHFLSGSAAGRLGERLGAPSALVPPVGPALHAALDAVPHWDYTVHRLRPLWSALDVSATIVLALWGFRRGWGLGAVVTGLASAAPDLDVANAAIPRWPTQRRFFPSHRPGFRHGRAPFRSGVLVQALVCLLALLVLERRRPA